MGETATIARPAAAELSPIARKFCARHDLDPTELQALEDLQSDAAIFDKGHDIFEEGRNIDRIYILKSGWAARYKILSNGQRQILNFLLPGDVFGRFLHTLGTNEHAICTLTDVEVARFSPDALKAAEAAHPGLAQAFYWAEVCEWSITCEHLVSIGRRCATARIAHLLLELRARLRAAGELQSDELELPFTQEMLADSLGLTHVHVSRSLKKLKERGLLSYERNLCVLLDTKRLAEESDYSETYLDVPN